MARVGFALLFGLTVLARMQAQPLANAAKPLADRISSLLPRRAMVSLDFQVLAPVPAAESSLFRQALTGELRKAGLEISAATQPDSRVRVSLSENAHGLLFTAEVSNQETQRVAMLPWSPVVPSKTKPAFVLATTPVWEQAEPILDFLLLNSDSQLIVLGNTRVASYRGANGHWALERQGSLPLAHPLPRDPRGRLELIGGNLRVFLAGTTCTGVPAPELSFTCTPDSESFTVDTRDPGLLGRWVTGRNTIRSESTQIAFYSAAAGLFASSDGTIVDRANAPMTGTEQWGSDIASFAGPCTPANVLIATIPAENSRHDQVQAFELINGQPVARSEALPLAGAVAALWPSNTPQQATLVIRNSTTGNYEASRLALACVQ